MVPACSAGQAPFVPCADHFACSCAEAAGNLHRPGCRTNCASGKLPIDSSPDSLILLLNLFLRQTQNDALATDSWLTAKVPNALR